MCPKNITCRPAGGMGPPGPHGRSTTVTLKQILFISEINITCVSHFPGEDVRFDLNENYLRISSTYHTARKQGESDIE